MIKLAQLFKNKLKQLPFLFLIQILSDKGRLIKRTQLKRTSYRVLGKSEKEEIQDMDSNKVC